MVAESGCRYIVVVATTDIIRLDTEQWLAMLERGYVFDEVVYSGDSRGNEDLEGLKDFCCKNNEPNKEMAQDCKNESFILDVILSKLSDVCANECSMQEAYIQFKNGSRIEIVTANDKARGHRCHILDGRGV